MLEASFEKIGAECEVQDSETAPDKIRLSICLPQLLARDADLFRFRWGARSLEHFLELSQGNKLLAQFVAESWPAVP